jgi:hypothetical protein
MNLHDTDDYCLCDYPNCNKAAIAPNTIYDEDGEDQGIEMLCTEHHPYHPTPLPQGTVVKDAYPELEAFFDRLSRKGTQIGF